ncbi:hypothetical protein HU200_063870 [Digitaria exilis]|uniref:F-box associated domain-containing protein n=1 Tax=Digitaria exilis TaxID=1010633 RepID=A0A835A548_9POAL|nr:hypothetical protein HU200_063870 [Digitaria exilis]
MAFLFVVVNIYIAVPRIENEVFEFSLHQGTLNIVPEKRFLDAQLSIAFVLQVGGRIIALSDTLESIYYLSRTDKWMHRSTYGLPDLQRKVNLSGYVVLSNDSFMISDADTCCCFLLDLQMGRWSVVYPYEELIRSLEYGTEPLPNSCWSGTGFLSGRSVFVDGFIYTCSAEGVAAYEVTEQGNSYYVSDQIDLKFPWRKYWESDRMCLDYVGKDTTSGTIMLCVVQGGNQNSHYGSRHSQHFVYITVVQIKTKRMHDGKLKPATVTHVDIGTSFIEMNERQTWTSNCFVVDP